MMKNVALLRLLGACLNTHSLENAMEISLQESYALINMKIEMFIRINQENVNTIEQLFEMLSGAKMNCVDEIIDEDGENLKTYVQASPSVC